MDRLLQQFLTVAETGGITAAARALNLTQPTLTFNMRKLEEDVGAQLLTRSSRGVRLTALGETFYENVRLMQRLYDNTLSTLHVQREHSERGISLACGYTWWSAFVKDMVLDYRRAFPNAPIRVNQGDQLSSMEQLLSGDITLFVSYEIDGLSSSAGADFIPLSQVYQGYFVREGHPLLGEPRTRTAIMAYSIATTAPSENRYRAFMNNTQRFGKINTAFESGNFAFVSNSMSTCVDFVLNSDTVLRHTHLFAPTLKERGLVEVIQSEPVREIPMGVYVLAEQRGEKRVADLLERIVHAGRKALPPLRHIEREPAAPPEVVR